MPDKIEIQLKQMRRDKEGNYILVKASINQRTITTLNIHTPNSSSPNFIKSILKELKI